MIGLNNINYAISVQDIFIEIARVLKVVFPNLKRVYQERIKTLDTPSVSIELVNYSTPLFSRSIINKRVDLDIIYFSKTDTIAEALGMLDKLTSAFSMGLKVYERNTDGDVKLDESGKPAYSRFIHVFNPPEHNFVDQDLHFAITFEFAEAFNPTYITLDKWKDITDEAGNIIDSELITPAYPIELTNLDESIPQKEIPFIDDEKGDKGRDYNEEELKYMENLEVNVKHLNAYFKL